MATAHARNFQMCQPEFNLEPQKPPFPFPLLLLRLLPFPFSLIFFSAAAQTMQKERDFSIFSLFVLLFYMGVCVWTLDLLCLHVGFSSQKDFVKKEGKGSKSKLFSFGFCGHIASCRNNQTTTVQEKSIIRVDCCVF